MATEGQPRLLYAQPQIPALPGGSPDIPKAIVRYNLSSRSRVNFEAYLQWDLPTSVEPTHLKFYHEPISWQPCKVLKPGSSYFEGAEALTDCQASHPIMEGSQAILT